MPTHFPTPSPEEFDKMTVEQRMDYLSARLKYLHEQMEETRRQLAQTNQTLDKKD